MMQLFFELENCPHLKDEITLEWDIIGELFRKIGQMKAPTLVYIDFLFIFLVRFFCQSKYVIEMSPFSMPN